MCQRIKLLFITISFVSFQLSASIRADSRFAPSQWETALLCNDVFHWLDASLESALTMPLGPDACFDAILVVYWWHWRISIWQPLLPSVKTKLACWQVFSDPIICPILCVRHAVFLRFDQIRLHVCIHWGRQAFVSRWIGLKACRRVGFINWCAMISLTKQKDVQIISHMLMS